MTYVNDEQLNRRIDTFLTKKHQEFPELSLRGDERVPETVGFIVVDKIIDSITSLMLRPTR